MKLVRHELTNSDEPLPWSVSFTYGALQMDLYYDANQGYNDKNKFQPLDGYHLIIHSTEEFPTESDYQFTIGHHQVSYLKLTPELMTISNDLKLVSPTKRNCYLQGEKVLKYFKVYTRRNCEEECLSDRMIETCGCVAFFLISEIWFWMTILMIQVLF